MSYESIRKLAPLGSESHQIWAHAFSRNDENSDEVLCQRASTITPRLFPAGSQPRPLSIIKWKHKVILLAICHAHLYRASQTLIQPQRHQRDYFLIV